MVKDHKPRKDNGDYSTSTRLVVPADSPTLSREAYVILDRNEVDYSKNTIIQASTS